MKQCEFPEHSTFYKFVVEIVIPLIFDKQMMGTKFRFETMLSSYIIINAPGMEKNGENRHFLKCCTDGLMKIYKHSDRVRTMVTVAEETINISHVFRQRKTSPN